MSTKDGDALTVQVDHKEYKAIFTCTSESIGVYLVAHVEGGGDWSLANYVVPRTITPRMDLLLSGIEAWSKELFTKVTAERGHSVAFLQDETSSD